MKPSQNPRNTTVSAVALLGLGILLGACNQEKKEEPKDEVASAETPAKEEEKKDSVVCKEDKNKRTSKDGKITKCLLAENATVGDYTCEKGKMIGLYADGKLKDCYLTAEQTVDDVPCKDALALYPDGKLRRCRTTQEHEVNGITVPAKSWISFTKGGELSRLEVKEPTEMGDVKCKGYANYFHPNGKLKRCNLAGDTEIEGKKLKSGASVCFDEEGKLADC